MTIYILIPFTLSLFITLITFYFLIKKKINFRLIAPPNEHVLTHIRATPLIGGIGIFLGIILPVFIFLERDFPLTNYLFGLIPVGILGMYKDRFQDPLSPIIQLVFQITTCIILYCYWNQVNQFSFSWLHMGLFLLICGGIINAYNFIDVMDGLAGSYIINVFIMLGVISVLIQNIGFMIFIFSFIGAIFAFLRFNWTPAKLFMGDFGSFGLIYSLLFILISVCPIKNNSSLIGYFFCFFVLILEFTFTCLRRILLRKSPFIGDSGHISIILLKKGIKSQTIVGYVILLTNLTNLVAFYYLVYR